MPAPVYVDYAATTPVDARVVEAMAECWGEVFGNPSSLHRWGRQARKRLSASRRSVLESLGGQESGHGVIFTSGGTEANNLVVWGVCEVWQLEHPGKRGHLITSAIEHPAVLDPCRAVAERLGFELMVLPVDGEGQVDPQALAQAIRPDETALVSIMAGNNEIGTLQNLEALGRVCRRVEVPFHTDAVQVVGKVELDLADLPVDYLTLSGHKIYGPKGVGALILHPEAPRPLPRQFGGGQEEALRSGTEPLPLIVGLATALAIRVDELEDHQVHLRRLQGRLMAGLQDTISASILQIHGPLDVEWRVPGNVHCSCVVPDEQGRPAHAIEGEALVMQLDLQGVAASSGSACHSAQLTPSHVVLATGAHPLRAQSSVRFSLGKDTTETDVDRIVEAMAEVVSRMVPAHASSPGSASTLSR